MRCQRSCAPPVCIGLLLQEVLIVKQVDLFSESDDVAVTRQTKVENGGSMTVEHVVTKEPDILSQKFLDTKTKLKSQ